MLSDGLIQTIDEKKQDEVAFELNAGNGMGHLREPSYEQALILLTYLRCVLCRNVSHSSMTRLEFVLRREHSSMPMPARSFLIAYPYKRLVTHNLGPSREVELILLQHACIICMWGMRKHWVHYWQYSSHASAVRRNSAVCWGCSHTRLCLDTSAIA